MELIRHKRIISEKTENFDKVYKQLPEKFEGAISIVMKVEGYLFKGDILIGKGILLGATLDDLDRKKTDSGESAFENIKAMVSMSKRGDIDVYSFDRTAMNLAIRMNRGVLFRHPLELARLIKTKEEIERLKKEKEFEQAEVEAKEDRAKKEEAKKEEAKEDRAKKEEAKKEEAKKEEAKEDRAKKEEAKEDRAKKEEEAIINEISWEEELNKFDEEWKGLEEEWEKVGIRNEGNEVKAKEEDVKELSVEATAKVTEKEGEGGREGNLEIKPKIIKNIRFTDRIKLLKFPKSSDVMDLLDGRMTLREICTKFDKDPDEVILLVDQLTKMGYIKRMD